MARIPTDPDALLTPPQAARFLGYTVRWLESRRLKGDGPRFIRVSARSIRYRRRDLIAWTEARERYSTAQDRAKAGAAKPPAAA